LTLTDHRSVVCWESWGRWSPTFWCGLFSHQQQVTVKRRVWNGMEI